MPDQRQPNDDLQAIANEVMLRLGVTLARITPSCFYAVGARHLWITPNGWEIRVGLLTDNVKVPSTPAWASGEWVNGIGLLESAWEAALWRHRKANGFGRWKQQMA